MVYGFFDNLQRPGVLLLVVVVLTEVIEEPELRRRRLSCPVLVERARRRFEVLHVGLAEVLDCLDLFGVGVKRTEVDEKGRDALAESLLQIRRNEIAERRT